MASNSTSSAAARLCALACRQAAPRANTVQRIAIRSTATTYRRQFTTTMSRWEGEQPPKDQEKKKKQQQQQQQVKNGSEEEQGSSPPAAAAAPVVPPAPEQIPGMTLSDAAAEFKNLEILDITAKEHGYRDFDEFVSRHPEKGPMAPRVEREFERWVAQLDETKVDKNSWWHDEDDPEMDCEEVEDFDEDDMTEMAHAKLEEIKEMRQYARRAVYELPLLSELAKPFEPPTSKQVLRWRYTTYFGESHPAESKVVVQFSPDDLGLTAVQADKLRKLAGTRYNPETQLVKMSFEGFEHPAQNKRHLADVVGRLIASAKDGSDTFADVPLDTRHHVVKPKPRFPKAWLMTEERRRFLDENRQSLMLDEVQRAQAGSVVDGKEAIEGYLLRKIKEDQEKAAAQPAVAAPAKSNARSKVRA
ncbi:small subunit ribosomal protein S35 [Geosmithia morbida]|uniref:Small subunit ribosomal protein S35 n=1 Tax=Geosmithia morbida TaxID=1094350 RepID=A0A9P5D7H5_9HYPO|nr:small subunit ribosomal protein S35 [Geosmithia morbida]KAF4125795.1 small subunit ribosomal protein S35 [Geosmithia morbida]